LNGKVKLSLLLVALALIVPQIVLFDRGVGAGDDPVTESHSIAPDGARAVEVSISLGAGELWLGDGASGLMDGTFTYSGEDWQPSIAYGVAEDVGQLVVEQGSGPGFVAASDWGDVRNDWEIMLNGALPISLAVEVGAGESVLDLADLDLTEVTIRTGAGGTTVDLAGIWDHDVRVSIEGGAGDVTILVPEGRNVEVRATVGIGQIAASGLVEESGRLVSESAEPGGPTLQITVQGGMGTIEVVAVPVG
jgi:hypothetical protein